MWGFLILLLGVLFVFWVVAFCGFFFCVCVFLHGFSHFVFFVFQAYLFF